MLKLWKEIRGILGALCKLNERGCEILTFWDHYLALSLKRYSIWPQLWRRTN